MQCAVDPVSMIHNSAARSTKRAKVVVSLRTAACFRP